MNEIETQARLWEMIQNAGPMVKLILFLLLLLSIFSWAIILYKLNLLRKVEKETSSFLDLFWKKKNIKTKATKNQKRSQGRRLK